MFFILITFLLKEIEAQILESNSPATLLQTTWKEFKCNLHLGGVIALCIILAVIGASVLWSHFKNVQKRIDEARGLILLTYSGAG
ncbi:hypothetical protein Zmor_012777 [Zophobas morio]|uniref:Uncharacterized protein n=1 Tax=Zophobas morio TaxID=2755281 RepID=A0AA38ICP8_9CUCU|nr:hypothetical protein Zmor_012777 [Zophobas morio]